ncbi:hypothetical protein KUL42_32630 [Alteromonas sp. KUL42]|uniref:hypothetical protein n=1 Tax=Alteromonas sp. KUL42 TaxID=2480797 RepID=UPI001035B8D7|nr:hypothetical protein [Alteromonas sp. KUL42]TAP33283.1 hypothetical protein EYR97_15375 [Alteromonas sp. KUL42]GEA08502.1 hypothetical protein KUL42_32630 [Alteromonas sp. KUL42]
MLTILKGFTGLWSARVTKLVLVVLSIGALYWYVSSLNEQIELQQVDIDAKEQQLIDKRAEIVSLKIGIHQANNATQVALTEIETREELAAQRLRVITTLREQLSDFETNLDKLEQADEQVKRWANEPVPVAVIGLLNNARDTDQNNTSYKGSKSITSSPADAGLFAAYNRRSNERRHGVVNRKALSVTEHVQF